MTVNATETVKAWDLFVGDVILVKSHFYDVLHIEEGMDRRIVVAQASNGDIHTFNTTTFKVAIKEYLVRA